MSGILSKTSLAAGVSTTVYTVPAGKTASVSMILTNNNFDSTSVSVHTGDGSGITAAGRLEADTRVLGMSVSSLTGLVLATGQTLVVSSSKAGCNTVVMGYEE